MVIFNELRITEDKECLIVDCSIEDIDGYDGMYIDSVTVEYYKNVTEDGSASDHAITMYEKTDGAVGITSYRGTLKASSLDKETFGTDTLAGGLFFITVSCDGTPENPEILASYSCGADNTIDVGVAIDWHSVYSLGIGYAAKLAYNCEDPCDIPDGFENFILYWYALQLAISTCDWFQVRKLWDKFMRALAGNGTVVSSGGGCGCNR